jgi:membrane-associated protein
VESRIMDISQIINFFVHLDNSLGNLISIYGIGAYVILFLIIFCETGLVFIPFLPGDSLIFIAGTFAAKNLLDIFVMWIIISIAAILGDTVNYWIGHNLGRKIFEKNIKFFNKENLYRAERFYDKHGGKTIIYARFIPILRSFAPFVAGIGKMKYSRFLMFNIIGGVLWASLFLWGGYFFGNFEFVKNNLSLAILIVIIISLIPPLMEFFIPRKKN